MTSGPLMDLAWTIAALLAFAASILRGGAARVAGGFVCLAWALSLSVDSYNWASERVLLFGIDVALTISLIWMTRTNRSPWLIFTAASALLLVINYGVYAGLADVGTWAFVSVSYLWSGCILGGLLWGGLVRPRARAAISRP